MNGPIEPNADLRQLANMMWQTYIALTLEGFTEKQALAIIGSIISAGLNKEES